MSIDPSEISEAELLSRAVCGDKQAFGALYERYLEQIYRYIYYRVADHSEAEDLTEMVFLKVWERLPEMTGASVVRNFRAWLYRVAHNLVVDRHRTHRPSVSLDQAAGVHAADPAPEDFVQERETAQSLAGAVAQLEPSLQQVILCRFVSQLSHAETAEVMGLNEGHVRVLQHRALKAMRSLLDKDVG